MREFFLGVLIVGLVGVCGCVRTLSSSPYGVTYMGKKEVQHFQFRNFPLFAESKRNGVETYVFTKDINKIDKMMSVHVVQGVKRNFKEKPGQVFLSRECTGYSKAEECYTYYEQGSCALNRINIFYLDHIYTMGIFYYEPLTETDYLCKSWADVNSYSEEQDKFVKYFNERADNQYRLSSSPRTNYNEGIE